MKLKSMISDMELENEYVLVKKDDDLLHVSKVLAREDLQEPRKQKQTSILAAYVMDGKKPVGLITKDDVLAKAILNKMDLKKTKAKDIMTYPFFSVDINDEVQTAVNLIIEKNFLTVPILEDGNLRGVFTVFDAIWALEMEEAVI